MPDKARRVIAAALAVLTGAAIVKELRKPTPQRTWHGRIVGVPYDFRPPTPRRLREKLWDPANPALFTPHPFGVGWGVNFARLAAIVTRRQAKD